jgi:TPR repeat protein
MTSLSQPSLPPLYFEERRSNKRQSKENSIEENENENENDLCSPQLPSEILAMCLGNFSDWGDLAKLACVQKSWSNILIDAAEHSDSSKWELALAFLEGTSGLQKNPVRAVRILKDLANVETDTNDKPVAVLTGQTCFAPALKKIAECYFVGTGVAQNSTTGLDWLKASFEHGDDLDAAHEIALLYEFGRNGVEVDVIAAAQWFEKAATAGHIEAMSELGLCYELGCGVEQNDEQALDWYTKAANLGHVTAKFSVGEAFEAARGVPQSDEEACLWYYRAALVGDEDSKVALRRLYDIARIVVPGVAVILNE